MKTLTTLITLAILISLSPCNIVACIGKGVSKAGSSLEHAAKH